MLYFVTKLIVQLYFYIYHRLEVFGREDITPKRPIILASNHASYLDPPVVGLSFYPEKLNFIAWEGLFKVPVLGTYLDNMGAVPVSHENKNSSASLLRMVMGFLNNGNSIFICPEGHRTLDGNLQPIEGGVAMLSLKTNSPVVPVWVGGSYRAMAPHMKFPRPSKITVTYGKEIDPTLIPTDFDEKAKRKYILDKIEEFYKKMDESDRKKYPR
ncbi:MAG: lysophospholipid acyltransferase family protein [Synergistaceae bacterium]